jgi:predicted DNA-binding transcriptional regulator YafY
VLLFNAARARYVAKECWHRDQRGGRLADGRFELRVPYSNPAELIMDILKYGPDVEVVAPSELRRAVAERLTQAAGLYGSEAGGEGANSTQGGETDPT